ncbi:MAG: hypothetical protein OIF50_10785 [Flavobacteriaceae bacterium]|nr:hypothetical protein [Flavobacteriaceae bacterium]
MKDIYKKASCCIFLLLLVSCGTTKGIEDSKINTAYNEAYKKSIRSYFGTLSKTDYDNIIKNLEKEWQTTLPSDKSILVHYIQNAPNCIEAGYDKRRIQSATEKGMRLSAQMCVDYNAVDFFVYAKDTYHQEYYQQMDGFRLDSGFFYEHIFTDHQNCAAFLVIKPNGDFYKYYGEDYYSQVETCLKGK